VPDANAGLKLPLDSVNPLKSALLLAAAARVTVTVYVCVVVPSCAVATTVTVLLPTLRLITPDAVPLVTAVPFTVTVALLSDTVGVTVMLLTPFATLAV
jgi:hypothetical protein